MATATDVNSTGLVSSAPRLSITLEDPGHWHFSREKRLLFHVTDDSGAGVVGLSPVGRVRTLTGDVRELAFTAGPDGLYPAKYAAWEIGSGYATSYSAVLSVEHEGRTYVEAWPFEVVRDGREDIFKADGRFSYQVRYGWVPGRPVASAEKPVAFYFEPRRSLLEGDALDRKQPWRAPSEHLANLTAAILVASTDGQLHESLPATYTGMGIYRGQRLFHPDEVGRNRSYQVSFLFTDPHNGEQIDVADNTYALEVQGL